VRGTRRLVRNLYLFVPTRKFFHRRKCLIRNGGDDETRTRDLCRDSFNDMEEYGRHCKSWEVHHRQRYCVSRCVSRVNYFFSL